MQSKLFTGVCSVHRCSSHAADISYYYFGMGLVFLMAKVKQSSIESFSGKKSTVANIRWWGQGRHGYNPPLLKIPLYTTGSQAVSIPLVHWLSQQVNISASHFHTFYCTECSYWYSRWYNKNDSLSPTTTAILNQFLENVPLPPMPWPPPFVLAAAADWSVPMFTQ